MAAAVAGIFSQLQAAGQTAPPKSASPTASPMAATSGDKSSSGGNSATISANDFLTLLVTEMKNQDPTANTNPNEYINQLVQVNSLEQLININQTLSTGLGSPTAGATGFAAQTGAAGHKAGALSAAQPVASGAASGSSVVARAARHAPGNISIPDVKPAAERVASALGGRPHAHLGTGALPKAQ